ncbi:MAG: YigZ family protein [Deltaproteobacteria bacterium]|nr:YigZ family protein [Deltaproteobacteria bacterium]
MSTILNDAKLTVKRSRFFAVLASVSDEEEIKALLAKRRRKVKRARHHCWAARLTSPDGTIVELSRDDGEVGRPGQRILEVLRRNETLGVLVVSRVFGGVKLGPAGVGRAFKQVAEAVFDRSGDGVPG